MYSDLKIYANFNQRSNDMQNLKEVAKVLADAKAEIALLIPVDQDMLRLQFLSPLERLVNRASFLGGEIVNSTEKVEYPPITEFMGEKIERMVPVKEEDLDPDQEAKDKFLAKIDTLQKDLGGLETKKILESYVTKEDRLVLRGLAKRANVEDYKDAEINVSFIEAIRQGFLAIEAAKAFKDQQNENIGK